jgi:hypothetical protein
VRAPASTADPLAVLLLPGRLEGLALEAHTRDLLSIPRVVALEPSRMRPDRSLRDAVSIRQARRLRFPGRPRLLVLYHPRQYPLARALCARHEDAELWYIPPARAALESPDQAQAGELLELDQLARQRATQVLEITDTGLDVTPLRVRLRELDVISPYAFIPGARPRPR